MPAPSIPERASATASVRFPTTNKLHVTTNTELGKNFICNTSVCFSPDTPSATLLPAANTNGKEVAGNNPTPLIPGASNQPSTPLDPEALTFSPTEPPGNSGTPTPLNPEALAYTPPGPPGNSGTASGRSPGTTAVLPNTADELDHLVNQAAEALRASGDWTKFFKEQRDTKSDWGDVEDIDHPARHLLSHYKA